ncbi:MAG: hypothetical protein E6G14_15530 [Actinobacteria bacterium]|nr:MAG: hypothetical protein E6G14_15530 [Actinomycetota bacterium]
MDFRLLGPLEAVGKHGSLPLGGPKQRALLAVLLLNANEVVSSDRPIDELVHVVRERRRPSEARGGAARRDRADAHRRGPEALCGVARSSEPPPGTPEAVSGCR